MKAAQNGPPSNHEKDSLMAFEDKISVVAITEQPGSVPTVENDVLALVQRNGADTTRKSTNSDLRFTVQNTLMITHRPAGAKRMLHTVTLGRRPESDPDSASPSPWGDPVLCRLTFDGPKAQYPGSAAALEAAFRLLLSALAYANAGSSPVTVTGGSYTPEDLAQLFVDIFGDVASQIVVGEG